MPRPASREAVDSQYTHLPGDHHRPPPVGSVDDAARAYHRAVVLLRRAA